MNMIVTKILGITVRERIANSISYALVGVCVMLGLQLKWAMKSPNPAEWNAYSASANDHLYEKLNVAHPVAMPVVSHRGGVVPGIHEAGTIARLNHNYGEGQRLFELDFSWTSDDQIVVKHDWNERSVIPTMAEYLSESPEDHASIAMVYEWLSTHPDAFIVTDCKKRSLEGVARIRMERPDLVPQFIPQIYQFKDYELVQSQGFRNIILTLYRCLTHEPDDRIVEFAKSHDLFAITIPENRTSTGELASRLNQMDIPTYVHTINDTATAQTLQGRGFSGIYSDTLTGDAVTRIALLP